MSLEFFESESHVEGDDPFLDKPWSDYIDDGVEPDIDDAPEEFLGDSDHPQHYAKGRDQPPIPVAPPKGSQGSGAWKNYVEPRDSIADTDEPEPDVPKAMGVLFGALTGWSPARENQRVGSCQICGFGMPNDPIKPGSRQYCAGCGRYGLDRQIIELLAEHPAPLLEVIPIKPAEPKPSITVPERFKYKQRGS